MKKVLVVLAVGCMLFSAVSAHALMNVYGEWLSSAAGGVGGGVMLGPIKAGVHFGSWAGVSVGGGINMPIMPLMDKITLGIDAEFHYGLATGIWAIPAGVYVDYKLTDNLTVYGGGGVDVYYWNWASWWGAGTGGTIVVGPSYFGGVKFGL